jgi:hypothetical protein
MMVLYGTLNIFDGRVIKEDLLHHDIKKIFSSEQRNEYFICPQNIREKGQRSTFQISLKTGVVLQTSVKEGFIRIIMSQRISILVA